MNHHPAGPCDQCDLAWDEQTGDLIVVCKNNNTTEEK